MLHQTIFAAIFFFGASVLSAPASEANPALPPEVAPSLKARSGEYLGGIDMGAACRERWGNAAYAEQRDNSCNGWKCNITGPTPITGIGVDVNRACTKQYGVSAYGWCTTDAYGWGCYKN